MIGYLYITGSILFGTYAQIMNKWRINDLGWSLPDGTIWEKIVAYISFLFDPYILTCVASASLASFCWTMAMSKLNLTTVIPLASVTPLVVFILGAWILNEQFTPGKLIGLVMVLAGVFVASKW